MADVAAPLREERYDETKLVPSRPNGMDPDSRVFEIRSLFLFPDGKAPKPGREFVADLETSRDRVPVEFLQDVSMYRRIQQGLHQRSLVGSRLNRQEHNDRFYERVVDRYMNGSRPEGG